MSGRNKKVHIITSTQRPDSSLFANGARDNYTFKLVLCNLEYWYVSLHSNEPIFVGVPVFQTSKYIPLLHYI